MVARSVVLMVVMRAVSWVVMKVVWLVAWSVVVKEARSAVCSVGYWEVSMAGSLVVLTVDRKVAESAVHWGTS